MRTYLKQARLKGFRTIKDVRVDFCPGLNIIIGKNGSGKTNFMSFLYNSISLQFSSFSNFSCKLQYGGASPYSIEAERSVNDLKAGDVFSESFLADKLQLRFREGSNAFETFSELKELKERIDGNANRRHVQFIRHGIDSSFSPAVSAPLSFDVNLQNIMSDELFAVVSKLKESSFNRALILHLIADILLLDEEKVENREVSIVAKVEKTFELFCNAINRNIKRYLPIEAIRLNPSYKVYKDDEKQVLKFQGLILDFNFNGNWLPFSSLSDGTKRLFYLFAEISVIPDYYPKRDTQLAENNIILVEEPELGIHPHQLHLIMDFLKDVSERNQVIVTTHSPQALNIISEVELHSLNICSFNKEEGTSIRKLDVNQIEKAKRYMEEMYLSDYWIHSNLENRD